MNKRSSSGFTLVELLSVITVVAILAALFLPVLNVGKSSAQRVKCVGNLRQLGIATQLYWEDNRGDAFRWKGEAVNGGRRFWFGWLQDGREGQRAFDQTQGVLHAYLGGDGIEVCPAMDYRNPKLKLKATGASYGYGYNIELSAPVQEPLVNTSRLRAPGRIVLFGDSAQVNTFQPPASRENPMLEEFYYLSVVESTVHFRHRKTANAAFCDGHVVSEKPLAGSLDLRLAGEVIGRLPPELLKLD